MISKRGTGRIKLRVVAFTAACLMLASGWLGSVPVQRRISPVNDYRPADGRYYDLARIAPFERSDFALTGPVHPPEAPGEFEREEPDGREDWFYFQRAYPRNSIPREARRQAWQARSRIESNSIEALANHKWRPIGPSPTTPFYLGNWGLTSGRVNAVAISPADPRIVIIGSSTGGIWRSANGGSSFTAVSDDHVDLAVGSIAFSKSSPSIVYAGMGDTKVGYLGSGVLKSTDAGITWSRVSNGTLPAPGTISKLEVDPANSSRIYVAQYSRLSGARVTSSGLYVSTDGGINWSRVFAGAPRDIVIDPTDDRRLYLGVSRIDGAADPPFGLYRSTDRGSTWSTMVTAEFSVNLRRDIRVGISAADPQRLYLYFGGWSGANQIIRLIVSSDGGATWSERNTGLFDTGQFGYNTYLAVSPADADTVYLGSRDVFKSTDAGVTWTNLTLNYGMFGDPNAFTPAISKTHADQHALTFVPGKPNEFYLGNDGGVAKSTDGGNSFQSLNATLTLTQFVGLAVHPTDASITYGGTQDNGSQRRSFGSSSWHEMFVGDGGRVVINPLDPTIVFVTYVRGAVYRYFANGDWFDRQVAWADSFGEPLHSPRIAFYPPFTGNGVNANLYSGSWRLYISDNLGESWFPPAGTTDLTRGVNSVGSDVLSAIAVARSDTNVIYTGSLQGRAMSSTDGGLTWTDVTAGLPDRSITSIVIDSANAANAYLAVSGFDAGHIFKTTNSGATWTDISNDLPDIPVNALLIDPVIPNIIYAGTDVGVFRSTNHGESWKDFSKGMPPVVVTEFSAQQSGLIQAATYGRGAYEFDGNQRPVIDSVSFDGKKKLTISGRAFGESPRVLINGEDKTSRIKSVSDTQIRLKAKRSKLGLSEGDNTIQVVSSDGAASNTFITEL